MIERNFLSISSCITLGFVIYRSLPKIFPQEQELDNRVGNVFRKYIRKKVDRFMYRNWPTFWLPPILLLLDNLWVIYPLFLLKSPPNRLMLPIPLSEAILLFFVMMVVMVGIVTAARMACYAVLAPKCANIPHWIGLYVASWVDMLRPGYYVLRSVFCLTIGDVPSLNQREREYKIPSTLYPTLLVTLICWAYLLIRGSAVTRELLGQASSVVGRASMLGGPQPLNVAFMPHLP